MLDNDGNFYHIRPKLVKTPAKPKGKIGRPRKDDPDYSRDFNPESQSQARELLVGPGSVGSTLPPFTVVEDTEVGEKRQLKFVFKKSYFRALIGKKI